MFQSSCGKRIPATIEAQLDGPVADWLLQHKEKLSQAHYWFFDRTCYVVITRKRGGYDVAIEESLSQLQMHLLAECKFGEFQIDLLSIGPVQPIEAMLPSEYSDRGWFIWPSK